MFFLLWPVKCSLFLGISFIQTYSRGIQISIFLLFIFIILEIFVLFVRNLKVIKLFKLFNLRIEAERNKYMCETFVIKPQINKNLL